MTIDHNASMHVRGHNSFRIGLTALALVSYGCGLMLIVPALLATFLNYDQAMQVTSDLAGTAAVIGLLVGCIAAVALVRSGDDDRALVAALVLAGSAGLLAFLVSATPSAATAALLIGMYFLAGPIFVAAAFEAVGPRFGAKFAGGLLGPALIATSAAVTPLLHESYVLDVLFALLTVSALMIAISVVVTLGRLGLRKHNTLTS